VNQVPAEAAARNVFEKLTGVTGRFLDARVDYLGFVPRDENLHRAIMAQTPLVDLFPLSPASRAMGAIADRLFDAPPPRNLDGGLKFLWQRLFREQATL
jgi:flagellar biosynthesis protein FlhG